MSCFKLQESISAAQRRLPDAAMARPHQGIEFEFAAARIFRRRAQHGLDNRHLPLVDDEHRDHFDTAINEEKQP
jgi:hypothetical protein